MEEFDTGQVDRIVAGQIKHSGKRSMHLLEIFPPQAQKEGISWVMSVYALLFFRASRPPSLTGRTCNLLRFALPHTATRLGQMIQAA